MWIAAVIACLIAAVLTMAATLAGAQAERRADQMDRRIRMTKQQAKAAEVAAALKAESRIVANVAILETTAKWAAQEKRRMAATAGATERGGKGDDL